jgi:hypothetical protein
MPDGELETRKSQPLTAMTDRERYDDATEDCGIEVTPEMIEAGVIEAWQDPNPPAFIEALVERIYRAMEQMRRFEGQTGVSARRQ